MSNDPYAILAKILASTPNSEPLSPPIYQTTAFGSSDDEIFSAMCSEPQNTGFYSRYNNPNTHAFASAVAALEGAEAGLAVASGMGAVSVVLLSLLKTGDHVIAQKQLYGGSLGLLKSVLPRMGMSVTFVDQRDVKELQQAWREETRLVFLETPSNPQLHLTDLEAVASWARTHDVLTVADNTVATPLNQKPSLLGIDLVVHSATKYLSGHSDVTAGVVVGGRGLIEEVWRSAYLFGATLDPTAAWLVLRGMRTLPMRVARCNETAQHVANQLSENKRVTKVHYPGLTTHEQHELACRQMTGFGGLVSFEVDGGESEAARVIANLRLAHRSASFGSFSTIAVHPSKMWSGMAERGQLDTSIVPSGLIRLSVGFEAAEQILDDIERALE